MDTSTLVWAAMLIVLLRVVLNIRDRIALPMTLPQILKVCSNVASRCHPSAKTGIPAREERWSMVPMSPIKWSLFDMIERLGERARVLGMTSCDVMRQLIRTSGSDSSRLDINSNDAEHGGGVQLQALTCETLDPIKITTANMDCSDIWYDARTMTFFSKLMKEEHSAYLKEWAAVDRLKQGTRDDS